MDNEKCAEELANEHAVSPKEMRLMLAWIDEQRMSYALSKVFIGCAMIMFDHGVNFNQVMLAIKAMGTTFHYE